MADQSLPRREELLHQVFRSILDTLKTIPAYQHTRFVSAVLAELIDDERMPLNLLVDAVDKARAKVVQL